MKNILLFIIAGVVGIGGLYTLQFFVVKNKPLSVISNVINNSVEKYVFSPEKAPGNSLQGKITLVTGDVFWESRVATEPAKIITEQNIQQGEKVKTATGSATLQFENAVNVTVAKDCEVAIVQTLPANMVFNQTAGAITYERTGTIPVSVRIFHLLLDMEIGKITVSVDSEKQIITVTVSDGSVTAAYNDLTLTSKVLKITKGKRMVFNDETRKAAIK